jgi:hypothetical protein
MTYMTLFQELEWYLQHRPLTRNQEFEGLSVLLITDVISAFVHTPVQLDFLSNLLNQTTVKRATRLIPTPMQSQLQSRPSFKPRKVLNASQEAPPLAAILIIQQMSPCQPDRSTQTALALVSLKRTTIVPISSSTNTVFKKVPVERLENLRKAKRAAHQNISRA